MSNKVICGCFNVTLSDMEDAIGNGTKSFKEFQDITGIGTGCSPCMESNESLFNKILDHYHLSLIKDILVL